MKKAFGMKHENIDFRVRKGAYAVVFNEYKNKVLAVQTPEGHHFLPGGGVEGNESDQGCLKREMIEETGYEIDISSFIGNAMCYFYSTKNEPLLSDGYFYEAALGRIIREPIEEGHYMQWVSVEDVEVFFIHEHQIWAIKKALHSNIM